MHFWRECGHETSQRWDECYPVLLIILNSNKHCVTQIVESIVSHGCFLRDCKIEHSLIGLRSRLESGAEVKVKYYCP